jgi:TP901 family phage tail tape measure protein
MTEQLTVQVNAATNQFNRAIDGVVARLGGKGVGTIAAAVAAANAAMAGVAAKGVQEFGKLEQGMNEVFTLLPGISQENMDAMIEDVQAFANEMGVTTDNVVPALYNSLSKGVPEGNVFEFLESAQQLAVGGVTDLDTAVQGLTTVTNAYGSEAESTQGISDDFFTAMKNGGTTVEDLSNNLGKVTPIAADLGIGFDEVASAMSAITKVEEKTEVAATNLRGAMNELGKEGTKASDAFQEATDTTFPNFIAGGGTLQDALLELADHADDQGLRINDMFGSMEAAQAAAILTTDNGSDDVAANMEEMGDNAGATRDAYDQMDQGINRAFERLKATMQTFMQELGEKFAPDVENAINAIIGFFDTYGDDVIAVFESVRDGWANFTSFLTSNSGEVTSDVQSIFKSFQTFLKSTFQAIAALWTNILQPTWTAIQPFVATLFTNIQTILGTALTAMTNLMNAFTAFLNGDFVTAGESFKAAWDTIIQGFRTIFENAEATLRERLNAFVTWLEETFNPGTQEKFNALKEFFNEWLDASKAIFQALMDFLQGDFQGAWENTKAAVESLWNALEAALSGIMDAITDRFTTFKDWLGKTFQNAIESSLDAIGSAFESLRDTSTSAMESLFTNLGNLAQSGMDLVYDAFVWLSDSVESLWSALTSTISTLVGSLADAIKDAFGNAVSWIEGKINDAINLVNGVIESMNSAFEFEIPGIGGQSRTFSNPAYLGGAGLGPPTFTISIPSFGPWTINPPDINTIDPIELAEGGIVNQATLAIVGEAGPEAVVPLDRMKNMGGNQTIVVELDGRRIAETTVRHAPGVLRLHGA